MQIPKADPLPSKAEPPPKDRPPFSQGRPPTTCEQTNTCENITCPHTSYVVGQNASAQSDKNISALYR